MRRVELGYPRRVEDGAVKVPRTTTRGRRLAISALLAGALVWGTVTCAGQVGRAFDSVAAADLGLLAVAAACEAVSYAFLGCVLRGLTRGTRLSFPDAIRVGLISYGLGTVLPAAPLEGMVMAARELEAKGLERRHTFVAVGLAQWYFARALFAAAAIACLVVAGFAALHASELGESWATMVGAALVFGVVCFVMGVVARRIQLGSRIANNLPIGRRLTGRLGASCHAWSTEIQRAMGARGNRARLLGYSVGAIAADAACFAFALRAAGVASAASVLVLAYAVAMIASMVPLLPAGFGVMETAVPAFLRHDHVHVAVALGGVLAYRALATLMPALIGAGALGHLRLRRSTAKRSQHGVPMAGAVRVQPARDELEASTDIASVKA